MALRDAPMVDVLKFDEKEAYNHDRPISSLIRTQLLHLHHAEQLVVPPKAQTNININDLHTERHASEYIQKVTALLHKYGQKSKVKKKAASRVNKHSRKGAADTRAARKSAKVKSDVKKRTSRR